jgi:hypothetical protein
MNSKKLRKIALYLKYIAYVLEDEAGTVMSRPTPKVPIKERNRRISEGLRLSWRRRKAIEK